MHDSSTRPTLLANLGSASTRRWAFVMVGAAATVAVLGLGGCYERVVAARGLGADQYTISEPYQENSKVDDWIFGERKTQRVEQRVNP